MDFGTALFLVVVLETIIIDLNMQMIHEKHIQNTGYGSTNKQKIHENSLVIVLKNININLK